MPGRRDREAEVAVVRHSQPRPTHRAVAGAAERRLPGAMEVPIEQVVADVSQPRQDWSYNDGGRRLRELADSVREFGVLQPLVVREEGTIRDGRQRYIIIAGARRRAAAEQAGLASLPVVVRGDESSRVRVLQLVENLQRQELSPLDEARAYQELIDLERLSPPALAARLHVSAQHVRDRLRVLADQVLADAVERHQIPPSVARDIMKLPDEEMERFRDRVQAGERVQLSDVVQARARLAAQGVVNPRRKGAWKDAHAAPVEAVGEQVGSPAGRTGGAESDRQTMDVAAEPRLSGGLPILDKGGEGGGDTAAPEQTVFVPGTGELAYSREPVYMDERKQTVFVQPSNPVTGGPPDASGAEISRDLLDNAKRLAAALNEGLSGKSRTETAGLLSGPNSERLWTLVYPMLKTLLSDC